MIGLPFSTSCSDEGPGEVGADDSEQSSDEATPGVTVPLSDKFIDMVVVEGSKIYSRFTNCLHGGSARHVL